MALADECHPGGHVMSIDTLTADTNINRASPQVAKKNWETPIPNGIQENEVPDTGTVDMDFWDFVDIVNPLQHIPVVSTIYRELTGAGQSGEARIFLIQDDNLTAEVPLRRSILQSTLRQSNRSPPLRYLHLVVIKR